MNEKEIEKIIRETILHFSTSFNKKSIALSAREKLKGKNIDIQITQLEQIAFKQVCLLENSGEIVFSNNAYRRKNISML